MLKDQGSRSGRLEGGRGATGDVPEETVRWERVICCVKGLLTSPLKNGA